MKKKDTQIRIIKSDDKKTKQLTYAHKFKSDTLFQRIFLEKKNNSWLTLRKSQLLDKNLHFCKGKSLCQPVCYHLFCNIRLQVARDLVTLQTHLLYHHYELFFVPYHCCYNLITLISYYCSFNPSITFYSTLPFHPHVLKQSRYEACKSNCEAERSNSNWDLDGITNSKLTARTVKVLEDFF